MGMWRMAERRTAEEAETQGAARPPMTAEQFETPPEFRKFGGAMRKFQKSRPSPAIGKCGLNAIVFNPGV